MIQARNIFGLISQSKCKRADGSSAPSQSLSLPFYSTFAAAAFAVVFLAGAFLAMPAQAHGHANSSSGTFSSIYTFKYNPTAKHPNYDAANPTADLVEDPNGSGDLFGVSQNGGSGTCTAPLRPYGRLRNDL